MLTFDNLEFDLGTIPFGVTKSVKVNLHNTGSTPIQLQSTNASCSCTSGILEYSTLQPQSKGYFMINFNTGKSGKGAKQVKSIYLNYTINRQTFSQIFRIKANVT